jgi:hypothetical protein
MQASRVMTRASKAALATLYTEAVKVKEQVRGCCRTSTRGVHLDNQQLGGEHPGGPDVGFRCKSLRWLQFDPSNMQLSFGPPACMNQLEVMTVGWNLEEGSKSLIEGPKSPARMDITHKFLILF